MSQRFTLDRQSFEQFLAAASLLQQFQRHASQQEADVQPFWALVDLQRAVHGGTVELDSVIRQVPELAVQLVGADGCGIWLFTSDDEFTWRSGTRRYAEDERLRLEVLSRLAAMEDEPSDWRSANRNWDAGYYPGCVKSLLVEPIHLDHNVAGAIAAFAMEFDAFTERDGSKLRLLGGVIGQALESAARSGLQQATALERVAICEVIERMIPRLQSLAEVQSNERHRSSRRQPVDPQETMLGDSMEAEGGDSAWSDPDSHEQGDFASVNEADIQTELEPPLSGIYVPGIGVRAALGYDDEKQPTQFWSHLRAGFGRAASLARGAVHGSFRAVGSAGTRVCSSIGRLASTAGAHVRDAAHHRPKLPSISADGIRTGLARTRTTCRTVASRAGGKVRAATKHVPVPDLPKDAIRQGLSSAEAWTESSLRSVGRALREVQNIIPDLPRFPLEGIREWPGRAAHAIGSWLRGSMATVPAQVSRWRPAPPPELKINWHVVRRNMPAAAVLLIMLAFLFSQPALHKTVEVASAGTKASVAPAAAVLPTTRLSVGSVAAQRSPDLSSSPTHKKITDPETESDLENMTRYEIANMRRAAQEGDDSYEFELGMAYEIGYDMSQNCAKAAEWVRRAAEAGNAAAEYNLGLRYRDGDGVTPDAQQSASWLRKAAAQKYAKAGQALASLNSH